uniref:Rubisco LSMT substrate-binding domain-containing protein n=2 Tax=Kalanchoe fedtschenkoi TaxID=63787 RepID=A0A7N0VET0_KALFE
MNGDPTLSFALRNHPPSLTSTQILAVCLLWELGKKMSSHWYPYLNHLPRCYYTLSTFPQFQIQMLQVDDAIWAAERASAEAESDWKGALTLMEVIKLKPRLRTLGAWLWASATISSRTLHIPWDEAGCLCPVGDLFNYAAPGDEPKLRTSLSPPVDDSATDEDVPDKLHDDQSDACTKRLTDGGFRDADAAYCFYARENYKKGEQVLLGYGLYTNLELLEHYGFLLSNNPNDRVFIELEPNMNYNTSWSKDLLYIEPSGKPSFALLSALRVWATPPSQRKSVSHLAYSGLQLSRQNEIVVMKWLMRKCHDILKTHPTTAQEDSMLLQTLDKVYCLGDLKEITNQHLFEHREVHCFLEFHSLLERESRVKLSEKLKKSVAAWKLAILWRLGYKKILHSCVTYCSDILCSFEI